jgi:hypothetical protein
VVGLSQLEIIQSIQTYKGQTPILDPCETLKKKVIKING